MVKEITPLTQRFFLTGNAAPAAGGGFTASLTATIHTAVLASFFSGNDSLLILRDFYCYAGYDLAASVGQFQQCGGFVSLDVDAQSFQRVKNGSTGSANTLFLPIGIRSKLDVVIKEPTAAISILFTIQPGTAIAAAAIQSIQINYSMVVDLFFEEKASFKG